eukprot:scaffold199485_cov22-Tisochrysis_lutea.AAC.1
MELSRMLVANTVGFWGMCRRPSALCGKGMQAWIAGCSELIKSHTDLPTVCCPPIGGCTALNNSHTDLPTLCWPPFGGCSALSVARARRPGMVAAVRCAAAYLSVVLTRCLQEQNLLWIWRICNLQKPARGIGGS